MTWLTVIKNERMGLKVLVRPKAKKTGIVGVHDGMLKLAVAAPPVDGKANQAITAFFAEVFGLKKKDVQIVSGERSRKKVVALGDLKAHAIRKTLASLLREKGAR
ncbi:MAG: DUF167 domain-containing protein [Desulfopila sp.]